MRKLFWCLAALGAMTLSMSAGVAQERAPSNRYEPNQSDQPTQKSSALSRLNFLGRSSEKETSAQNATPTSEASGGGILRYQRNRPADQGQPTERSATGLQNYHRELFGTAPPPVGSSANAVTRQLSATPGGASSKQDSPFRHPAVRPVGATQAGTPDSGVVQAGGFGTEQAPGRIMQADFARKSDTAEPIEQTSGSSAAPLLPLAPGGQQTVLKTSILDSESAIDTHPIGRANQVAPASGPAGGFVNFTQSAPHIETRWTKQSDINVGQPCELMLTVKNSGEANASDVVVDVFFPRTVRLTAASPKPAAAEASVVWEFPSLDAGEERDIHITMIPSQRGELTANANVRFSTAATMLLAVEEPMLKLVMQGPKEVMMGEPASHVVTVSNPGTGVAHNVTLEVNIPEGLEHPKGRRLKMELGSVNPGEQRSVRLSLTAVAGGSQNVSVIATSGTELRQTANAAVAVLAPSLNLAVTGPALRYVGRDARYSLNLVNDGQAVTTNVRAMYVVPKGFEYLFASRGGNYDETTRTVTWFVGSVSPKETIELSLKLKPIELGDFHHVARAVSEHGAIAEAKVATRIEGTASLVLEVLDLDDPVEIGRETAYEVRVRNEGSKEAQNVGLSFELPTGVKLINVKGPTQHIAESGLVVFKALPALEAGKTAIFQIHIRGADEGNHRVRARLTSDSIQEPLTVEELTRFYAD
ncbi:MAG: hypothetical protein O2945_08865 [Planctomycetota bacterium]|nr:hypothetical protein [Planctomycetota bacterium]MDA0919168.1 hypothetical protein [Planctomycetota bacterium]MDA1163820.1 hypothetical protein [Planctomycetota bacterium]